MRAVAGLGLRNFVGVMHWNVILSAAVNVEQRVEILACQRRALNVPA